MFKIRFHGNCCVDLIVMYCLIMWVSFCMIRVASLYQLKSNGMEMVHIFIGASVSIKLV